MKGQTFMGAFGQVGGYVALASAVLLLMPDVLMAEVTGTAPAAAAAAPASPIPSWLSAPRTIALVTLGGAVAIKAFDMLFQMLNRWWNPSPVAERMIERLGDQLRLEMEASEKRISVEIATLSDRLNGAAKSRKEILEELSKSRAVIGELRGEMRGRLGS